MSNRGVDAGFATDQHYTTPQQSHNLLSPSQSIRPVSRWLRLSIRIQRVSRFLLAVATGVTYAMMACTCVGGMKCKAT